MKKLILSAAMLFALSTSASVMAQTPATPKKVTKTECCSKDKKGSCDCKGDKKDNKKTCTCKGDKKTCDAKTTKSGDKKPCCDKTKK